MLGDPTRRAIFECLARRPMAVGELADELPVSRPAVSQHLKVLKQAALVTDHAEGTRRIYRIDPAGISSIRAYLDQMWNQALDGFTEAAQRIADQERRQGLGGRQVPGEAQSRTDSKEET